MTNPTPIKKKRLSKLTILFTIVVIGAIGLVGVFNNSPVNIEAYAEFVRSFATIFVPFAAVIAVGGESKRFINMKYGENSVDIKPEK
jgi:hypothetical protein